jgi:hypothetical protein
LPGYSNAARTDQEKKNDRELDRAYESTIKGRPDAKKNGGGQEQAIMNVAASLPAAWSVEGIRRLLCGARPQRRLK